MWELEHKNEQVQQRFLLSGAESGEEASPSSKLKPGEQYLTAEIKHLHVPRVRSENYVLFWSAELYDGVSGNHTFQQLEIPDFLGRTDKTTREKIVRSPQKMFGPLPWHGEITLSLGLFNVRSNSGYQAYLKRLSEIGGLAGRAYFGQAFSAVDKMLQNTFSGDSADADAFELIVGSEERLSGSDPQGAFSGTRVLVMEPDINTSKDDYKIEGNRLYRRTRRGWKRVTKQAYIIYDISETEERTDWLSIPDIQAKWFDVCQAYEDNAPILLLEEMIEGFARTCRASLDLTDKHGDVIASNVRDRFLDILDDEEMEIEVVAAEAIRLEGLGGDTMEMGRSVAERVIQRTRNFRRQSRNLYEIINPNNWEKITEKYQASQDTRQASPDSSSRDKKAPVDPSDANDQNFEKALQFVAHWEGGEVNHEHDRGGHTNHGVTQKTYDAYRLDLGLPMQSVSNITKDEVRDLFYRGYWLPVRAHELGNFKFSLALFDTAINMGPGSAIRRLQEAMNAVLTNWGKASQLLSVDGGFGPNTKQMLDAILAGGQEQALLIAFCDARHAKYERICENDPDQTDFFRGWINRLNDLRKKLGIPERHVQFEGISSGESPQAKTPDHADEDINFLNQGLQLEGQKKSPRKQHRDVVADFVARLTAERKREKKEALAKKFVRRSRRAQFGMEDLEDAAHWLRTIIAFEDLELLAKAVMSSGQASDTLLKYDAQAKIEAGKYSEAAVILDGLLENTETDPRENLEALGLKGRIGKQIFVNSLEGSSSVSQEAFDALIEGANAYRKAWELEVSQSGKFNSVYQGGNLLAVACLGQRHGIEIPDVAAERLSTEIQDILASPPEYTKLDAWNYGTLVDCHLAVKNWEKAEKAMISFLDALEPPGTFEVRSTRRQMRDVWRLHEHPSDSPGYRIYALIDSFWRSLPGGGGLINTASNEVQLQALGPEYSSFVDTKLEALNGGEIASSKSLRGFLERAERAIALIEDKHGNPVGTGFVTSSTLFFPNQPSRPVLITNHHVINRDGVRAEPDLRSLRPDEAYARFTALPDLEPIKIGGLLWQSYFKAHDTTILEINIAGDIAQLSDYKREPYNPTNLSGGKAIGYVAAPGHPQGAKHVSIGYTNFDLLQMRPYRFKIPGNRMGDAQYLHYLSATEGGSSGSPVVDLKTFELVGVHHGAKVVDVTGTIQLEGRRLNVQMRERAKRRNKSRERRGQQYRAEPTVTSLGANEGIWIGSIQDAVNDFPFGIEDPTRRMT